MRAAHLLLPILLLLPFWSVGCDDATTESQREIVLVVRVVDGDTVELEDGRRVRYIGVDTPEIAHSLGEDDDCFGPEAMDYNALLVAGRQVALEYDEEPEDHYGRTLAWVWLLVGDSERLVSEELVRKGYGTVLIIPPNGRYAERLEAAQAAAQADGAGLWSSCP